LSFFKCSAVDSTYNRCSIIVGDIVDFIIDVLSIIVGDVVVSITGCSCSTNRRCCSCYTRRECYFVVAEIEEEKTTLLYSVVYTFLPTFFSPFV